MNIISWFGLQNKTKINNLIFSEHISSSFRVSYILTDLEVEEDDVLQDSLLGGGGNYTHSLPSLETTLGLNKVFLTYNIPANIKRAISC